MICFPNAKINLGLFVTEKRADGYHNLETLFYPIKLHDVLEIIENKESREAYLWSSSGIKIDGNPADNLCIKALMLLKKDFRIPSIKIHLHKVVPFGAGLGGGSADAAFTLITLNQMFKLGLTDDQLAQYAKQIGADCPFFIYNKPCIAKGIGNEFEFQDLQLPGKYIQLIKPDIHISTPEAYRGIKPKLPKESILHILNKPVEEWKDNLINDFEASVFPNHTSIEDIKKQMYDNGAIYSSMTGSGAAVFGIFEDEPDYTFKNCFNWIEKI